MLENVLSAKIVFDTGWRLEASLQDVFGSYSVTVESPEAVMVGHATEEELSSIYTWVATIQQGTPDEVLEAIAGVFYKQKPPQVIMAASMLKGNWSDVEA